MPMNLRDLLFRFSGQIDARDYLAGVGANSLGFLFLSTFNSLQLWALKQMVWPALVICALVLLYSIISLVAKRLRYMGLSLWLLFVPILLGVASVVLPMWFGRAVDTPGPGFMPIWIASFVASWVQIAFFLWLGVTSRVRGTT